MKEEKPAFRFNEQSPEARWRRLDAAHRAAHDALMARSGLERIGNPVLLMILAHQPGGVIASQRELADHLHVTPATVTVSLRTLERGGYIVKQENECDLRRKPIAITDKGREAVEKIEAAFDELDTAMYRGFSEEEKEAIAQLYDRMSQNLIEVAGLPNDPRRQRLGK